MRSERERPEMKCIVHRLGDEWTRSRFPDGQPGVVQWEDDARFFLRCAARELRSAGHEIASDYLMRELARECGDES